MLKIILNGAVFTLGFIIGNMIVSLLILNKPEVIYIAETLVACKEHGGIAYLSNTGVRAKCKDGALLDRAEGPEVIKYYNYIKQKQIFGVTYIDYIDFDYSKIEDKK